MGEFLKELELTEGRATGIPTILKELKENGSPAPRFYTDDDRTLFEVELFIHPAFSESAPIEIDLGTVTWDLRGIDHVLNLLIERKMESIAGDIAGNQVGFTQSVDIQCKSIIGLLNGNQAGDIAGGIAGDVPEKMIQALSFASTPVERKELLKEIGLVSNVKNFNTYIAPLVAINWLTMTIPHKPTSPNQKYLTTLKGRLVLELMKRNKNRLR